MELIYTLIFLSNFYFNVAHQLQCFRANQVTGMGSIVTFQNGIPVPFFPRPTVSITVTITFTYNESKNRITTKLLTHFCILLLIFIPSISHFHILQTLVCCSVSLVVSIQSYCIKVEH